MTPQQRKFKSAARRCRGNAVCMSKALSGYGKKGKKVKRVKRKGMGILPGSSVSGGTTCTKTKMVYSPFYGKKVKRCATFSFTGKGKRGIWAGKYDSKLGYHYAAPNAGESCKGYKTTGRGCNKPRCASFTKKVGAATPAGAKAACKKAKGYKTKAKKKGKGKKKKR